MINKIGNKKIITVNFYNFWVGFGIEEFKYRVVPFLVPYYNFILSNNPEFLIFSNTARRDCIPQVPSQFKNTIKIFFEGEYLPIDMNRCDWAFTNHYIDNERHYRFPYYVLNMLATGGNSNDFIKKDIDIKKIKNEKTKFCNYLSSNCTSRRNNFFKKLSKYKKIDAAGKCCNNMGKILPNRSCMLPLLPGETAHRWSRIDKHNFQSQYKFSIAFQNDRADFNNCLGYVTEIFTDPMLVNSIPLHWGNPRIGEDWNTKSFISYHDFDSEKEFIDRIIEIDNNDKLYEEMLLEPWLIDNKLNKALNLNLLRAQFIKIFG